MKETVCLLAAPSPHTYNTIYMLSRLQLGFYLVMALLYWLLLCSLNITTKMTKEKYNNYGYGV